MSTSLYVGLMSGTSADGIDACLASFADGEAVEHAHLHHPYDDRLRAQILRVCSPGATLADAATLDVQLADTAVIAVASLLAHAGCNTDAVRAIGSHGQTVLHRPRGDSPTTIQLADPHRIAVRTGIDTVADFRRADIAAGGEGAPLAPGFHARVFASTEETRAVLNLGGIANITLLPPDGPVTGFDTGPANVLLDLWAGRHLGERFDAEGAWGAGGQVHPPLLAAMQGDPWFRLPPPKSTGREHFDADWLEGHLAAAGPELDPQDVQATLAELTAASVGEAVESTQVAVDRLLVCGGGARNPDLLARLRRRMPDCTVETTDGYGFDPQHVEPMAFAWLAQRRVEEQPGNCPSVTGADRELVLGSLIRAPRQR